MDYTDNVHRGLWAGHRFDITTLDRHKQGSLEGTEWKNVSEEVTISQYVTSKSLGRILPITENPWMM